MAHITRLPNHLQCTFASMSDQRQLQWHAMYTGLFSSFFLLLLLPTNQSAQNHVGCACEIQKYACKKSFLFFLLLCRSLFFVVLLFSSFVLSNGFFMHIIRMIRVQHLSFPCWLLQKNVFYLTFLFRLFARILSARFRVLSLENIQR